MVRYLHTSSGPVALPVVEVSKPHLSEDYMVKASLILHIAVIWYRIYLVQLLFSPSYNHFLLSPHPLTAMLRSGHTHTAPAVCLAFLVMFPGLQKLGLQTVAVVNRQNTTVSCPHCTTYCTPNKGRLRCTKSVRESDGLVELHALIRTDVSCNLLYNDLSEGALREVCLCWLTV